MANEIWIAILLPLAAAVFNGLWGWRLPKRVVGAIACGAVAASFLVALSAFAEMCSVGLEARVFRTEAFEWIAVGDFVVPLRFLLDPLSMVMTLVVTGVGLLIHLYSAGYMAHDERNWSDHGNRFARFFTFLNLFMAAMLTLVLADNYVLLFVGWEGVGLCSYLLIGFWFERPSAVEAGKKAFIVNRIGDFAFAVGLMILWRHLGALGFEEVFESAQQFVGHTVHLPLFGEVPMYWLVSLCLFFGACGKSAQIPLYVWLPDAMEGPTPVSALIHAATMVTAGVYLVARSHVLFELGAYHAPLGLAPLTVVALIGLATLLLAASIGLVQNDLKRVLAYSTVSQLGYMFLGLGLGAYGAAIFHLYTHAFFKALLFLGSGSVIHAMEHALHQAGSTADPQDMRNMGGLFRPLRTTSITFLVGALALAGFPLLSGFWSKDAILAGAYLKHPALWALGLVGATMTAFYMTRQCLMVFFGPGRMGDEAKRHLHESPGLMTMPLVLLAVGAIVAGWVWLPGRALFREFLAPVLEAEVSHHAAHPPHTLMFGGSIAAAFLGLLIARAVYGSTSAMTSDPLAQLGGLYRLLLNKFYLDELYNATVVRAGYLLSNACGWVFDLILIDGLLVNGLAGLVALFGKAAQRAQSGYVRSYALSMVLGGVLVATYFVVR